nr:hypothetical protein [Tanacetum cinerariifolium]
MYYPRFIKVIIHHFMSKDLSIPRRNKVNWHYVRDDHMFSTIKLVSRHQNTQQFGALLPIELTNEEIRNSNAHKEYYAVATGAPPKPKASVQRTRSSSDTSITPPTIAAGPRVTASAKGKQTAKASKAKSLSALSEVAMTEAQQLKLATKRSLQQTHISQRSGSGADEGTGSIPEVLDVPTDESEEELFWNSTDDEGADNEGKDGDDDEEDKGDNGEEGDGDDDNKDDNGKDGDDDNVDQEVERDDDKDDEEEGGDDEHESKEKESDEETRDEESFDHIPKTPENSKDEGNGDEDLGLNVDGEEGHSKETTSQLDVPTPTSVAPFPMTAPTMTPSTIATITTTSQASILPTTASSFIIQDLPNFSSLFGFDNKLRTLEANFSEFTQTNQFAGAVSANPGIVQRYMDQRMNEAVKVAVQIQSDRLRDEAQKENDEFLKSVEENMKKIIKEQVKDQVKVQVFKILPRIEKAMNEQLKAEALTRSSHSSKTSYAVVADLSEMELKKILIEKMKGNKSIQRSNKQRNLYKALVEAYESDKIILDTYGETVTLKRRRDDDADKDEEPSAGPDRGSKRHREGKEPESASVPSKIATRSAGRLPLIWMSPHIQSLLQKPPTSDRDWNKTLSAVHGSIQPWISELAKQADSRSSFNELMDTPLDFSNFLINRLKVDTLTPELLADKLYRDVNINHGRGLQVSQDIEDSHVTLTLTHSDGQQESSSTSAFVTNLLNPIIDPGIESIFMTGSSTVTPIPSPQSTMTPSIISTFTTRSQLSTPPTPIPSLDLQSLPTFASVFSFEDREKLLEVNFSNIPGIVHQYMHQQMPKAVREAVQTQTDRLQDSIQRENDEFLKTIDDNMKKIIKEQVKTQVKAQVTRILPRIEESVNAQLKAEVLTRSSHSSRTSYAVAADLSEMELKKILIDKMEGNKSIQRSDEQRYLYKALVEAYDADKTILDTYGESAILKRRREEDDDQEGPSAGSDRGSKRQRKGGEHASANTPSEQATGSAGRSTTGTQSRQLSASEFAFAEEPVQTTCQMEEPSHSPRRPPTPDRDWNKSLLAAQENAQSWISVLAKQTNARSSFNELLDTPIDFSNFIMNRLGVDTLTPELLAGLTYELMRGSCNSLTELEYHLEEVYKEMTDQGRRVIPFEHFINNDLEYLWGGASSRKYTTSVTKTKAADYGHIKWIEDLVPLNRESALDVYSKRRIITVTDLKIMEWHNYKHLDWISVRRDDDKIYKFKEGDFKRLRFQDIEDMLLLIVQGKLSNLTVEERFAFNVSLRMFTRSIVIHRHTYRSDLKRREAYTAYSNPKGFIYQNRDKKNRLMRIDDDLSYVAPIFNEVNL